MNRFRAILKVPLNRKTPSLYTVAVSLSLSPNSPNPTSANAILFHGDRVAAAAAGGGGTPLIEKLSDPQTIADILISKFGESVNAWVIEAPVHTGPFAVYRDFIPTVNRFGEPESYDPKGFPASTSISTLISNCFNEIEKSVSVDIPKLSSVPTYVLGFSKGGTVINQLVTELSCSGSEQSPEFLDSIWEVHYVDVGLNCRGAYVTDCSVIEAIGRRLSESNRRIRFVLHGTPRQWGDERRNWIREEKEEMVRLLELEVGRTGGKLQVCEKVYFSGKEADLEMHFEVLEAMDVG
ncbi:Mitochondrial protein C2orf69 [Linum perenne]